MSERPGPSCTRSVLDESGDAHPCMKRPHVRGPCVAVVGEGKAARVVWGGTNEVGLHREPPGGWEAEEPQPFVAKSAKPTTQQLEEARIKGFDGDACGTCGAMTLVPNGRCKKCVSCGSTDGCS